MSGEEPGLRGGRAKGKKLLVGIAVERRQPRGLGRCRMARAAERQDRHPAEVPRRSRRGGRHRHPRRLAALPSGHRRPLRPPATARRGSGGEHGAGFREPGNRRSNRVLQAPLGGRCRPRGGAVIGSVAGGVVQGAADDAVAVHVSSSFTEAVPYWGRRAQPRIRLRRMAVLCGISIGRRGAMRAHPAQVTPIHMSSRSASSR
jgi:hypothetical protein